MIDMCVLLPIHGLRYVYYGSGRGYKWVLWRSRRVLRRIYDAIMGYWDVYMGVREVQKGIMEL